jgi:hypothetical protein
MWGRLSFRSHPKKLKTAWNDLNATRLSETYGNENDFDINTIKAVAVVVDCILTNQSAQQLEEMLEEVDEIVVALLDLLVKLQISLRRGQFPVYPNNTSDEVMFLFEDLSSKIMGAVTSLRNESSKMRDRCLRNGRIVGLVLQAAEETSAAETKLGLLNELEFVCMAPVNVSELINHNGFSRMFKSIPNESEYTACREKLMSIIVAVLKMSNSVNEATRSNSSSDWTHSKLIVADREKSKEDNISLAAKGLNLAANVIGEILKLAPISSNWTKGDDAFFMKEKETSDDDIASQIELIAVPADTLADEGQRIDGLLSSLYKPDMQDIENNIIDPAAINIVGNPPARDSESGAPPASKRSSLLLKDRDVNQISMAVIDQGGLEFVMDTMPIFTMRRQALVALAFCRLLLLKNDAFHITFYKQNGYEILSSMLRTSLLSDSGATAGQEAPVDVDLPSFHAKLIRALVELVSDENVVQLDARGAFVKSTGVGNPLAFRLLALLVQSKIETLLAVAVRAAFTFLKASALHVVAMERMGLVGDLCEVLVYLVLDPGALLMLRLEDYNFVVEGCEMVGDIVLLVQHVAVALSCRDISILSLLTSILYIKCATAWLRSGNLPPARDIYRCQNCEDDAVFDCIHEACLAERKFRFCRECDRVFHKPLLKRAHIRTVVNDRLNSDVADSLQVFQTQFTSPGFDVVAKYASCGLGTAATTNADPLLCIILAAVRGILDDRRCRLQAVPVLFLQCYLVALKNMVCCEPVGKSHVEGGCTDWAQLADCRHDTYSIKFDSVHAVENLSDEMRPPEDSQSSTRRCLLSLFLQCIGRLLLIDKTTPVVRMTVQDNSLIGSCKSERQALIEVFRKFGGDALLTHLLLPDFGSSVSRPFVTSRIQVTSYDRHYIAWILRETVVTAIEASSPHVSDVLKWIIWLLGINVQVSTALTALGAAVSPHEPVSPYSEIPSGGAVVSTSTRYYLLQELRLLISGCDGNNLNRQFPSSFLYEIPLSQSQYGIGGKRSRNASFDHRERQRSNTTDSGSSTPITGSKSIQLLSQSPGESFVFLLCRVPSCSADVKEMLCQLGLPQLLTRILFGDLCPPKLRYLLSDFLKCTVDEDTVEPLSSNRVRVTAGTSDPPTDFELDEWISCFVLLLQLMANCDRVKMLLDVSNGTSALTKLLIAMIHTLSNVSSSDWHLGGSLATTSALTSLLTQVLLELCVGNGRLVAPCKPFVAAMFGASVLSAAGASAQSPQPGDNSAVQILIRALLSNIRISCETLEAEDAWIPSGVVLSQLSPMYYLHSRLLSMIAYTMQPAPLSLKPESLSNFVTWTETSSPTLVGPSNNMSHVGLKSGIQLTDLIVHKLPSGTDLHALDTSSHVGGASAAATRRRSTSLRSKLSSASLQNLDGDVSNAWEMESNGLNSHHSTSQLSTVFAVASALRSHTGTPNASLNGDLSPRKLASTNSRLLGQMLDQEQEVNREGNAYYVPLFESLDVTVSPFVEKLLLLFNDVLLFKSGQWTAEEILTGDYEDIIDGSEHAWPVHRLVHDYSPGIDVGSTRGLHEKLRTTASVTGAKAGASLSLTRSLASFVPSGGCVNKWKPQFSKLSIRSKQSAAVLLSLCLLTQRDVQTFCLGILSNLLECNHISQRFFEQDELKVLIDLLSLDFEKNLQIFRLLSQLVRNNIEAPLLLKLLLKISHTEGNQNIFKMFYEGCSELPLDGYSALFRSVSYSHIRGELISQTLCVVGDAAKRESPEYYLHFGQDSALQGGLQLSPCANFPERRLGFSVCCWVRVGCLGHRPISSLFQMSSIGTDYQSESVDVGVVMDVFFRTAIKRQRESDSDLAGTYKSYSTADATESHTGKYLQLCISFGNSKEGRPSRQQQVGAVGSGIGIADVAGNEQDSSHNSFQNDADWENVTDGLCKNVLFEDPAAGAELDNASKQYIRLLSSSFARLGLPDFIVEFDWTEIGDWHLLCLSVVGNELSCIVDGKRRTVLSWTKNGYMNHDVEMTKPKASEHAEHAKVGRSPLAPKVPIQRLDYHSRSTGSLKAPAESRLEFSYPCDISRKHELLVAVGSQLLEKNIASKLQSLFQEKLAGDMTTSKQLRVEQCSDNAMLVVNAYESMVSGFAGAVGEFAVFEGVSDVVTLHAQYTRGPDAGLTAIKGKRLTGMSPFVIIKSVEEAATKDDSDHGATVTPEVQAGAVGAGIDGQLHIERKRSFPRDDKKVADADSKQKESSFFTLFSSASAAATLPAAKIHGDEKFGPVKFIGNVHPHRAHVLETALKGLGGFRVLYPLLVSEQSRQISSLRVIHDLIISSDELYTEYLLSHTDKVIAFCCQKTTQLVSMDALRVIFDSICSPAADGSEPVVARPAVLAMLFDIAARSWRLPQLSRAVLEWTKNMCDDVPENCGKVMEILGLGSVFVLLSAWLHREVHESVQQQNEVFRVQLSCGFLLRVLITGSSGQLPQLEQVPLATQTVMPTGFSAPHLHLIFCFVQNCVRLRKDYLSTGNAKVNVGSSNWYFRRPDGVRRGNVANVLSSVSSSVLSSRVDSAEDRPVDWYLTAAIIALDSVIGVLEGPLSPLLINVFRAAFSPAVLWYLLLDWMGNDSLDIRTRAVKLMHPTLALSNGQLDVKAVVAFEKMNGFICMADQLSQFPPDDTVTEMLLSLLFWRYTAYVVAKPAAKMAPIVRGKSVLCGYVSRINCSLTV